MLARVRLLGLVSSAVLIAALAAAVLATGALLASAGADPGASRVIDQSFSCRVKLRAGARRVEPSAWSGFRDTAQGPWNWLPFADLGGRDIISYVFVSAGSPPPKPEQGVATYSRWLGVDAALCTPAKARVRLSSQGLQGGKASQLRQSDEYECSAPARILIRLRAEFAMPVTFRAQPLFGRRMYTTTAATAARAASFVSATEAGKPLVYASVAESGKATLFTAPSCVPD